MFWRIPNLSPASPVESILDKENFTLEELLDEEEIIQECKALNPRLINFFRDRVQVEQLLRYIVDDAPEDAESNRAFKFPFIACEVFTCEIDVILKTLVEDEELMNLLFSFLEPNRSHSSLLAGYFSKVVVCLMLRKTTSLMNYVQVHDSIFQRLVDLIGITSIMEVLVRLVGADDHMHPNFMDVMQWLSDSNLLEIIVDKLSPSSPPEVHANAAEVLWAIARNAPSVLASKLSSPSFVARIFGHALKDSPSKSSLVHTLSVCISLLDPRRSASSALVHSIRGQHLYDPPVPVSPETVSAMLPKLDNLLEVLTLSSDGNILPTTYGELRPPLGKHRLKIVEFIAVLLGTCNEAAQLELVRSGSIKRVIDLFFEYPFNNALHHLVENIIVSCLESTNSAIIDYLFNDCDILAKFLQADKTPKLSSNSTSVNPTLPAFGRQPPRVGYLGHITRIANKLVQLGSSEDHIQAYLQENGEWIDWETNVLHERNVTENVCRWACGRPTTLQERTRDSDEDELQDRDYDVSALANNLSQVFRYSIYENEDADEVHGSRERDDEDVYFDDESTEVVISSQRLGNVQESNCLFTNSNWFAFQEEGIVEEPLSSSAIDGMDEINLVCTSSSDYSDTDVRVVTREEKQLNNTVTSPNRPSVFDSNFISSSTGNEPMNELSTLAERARVSDDLGFFQYETPGTDDDLFSDRILPDWAGWREASDIEVSASDIDLSTLKDPNEPGVTTPMSNGNATDGCPLSSPASGQVPSLFEEDAEFVGVELEGVEKVMERALEGVSMVEGCLLKSSSVVPEMEITGKDGSGILEFNDKNYWRVEQELGVVQE